MRHAAAALGKNSKVAMERIKSTTLEPLCGSVGAIWLPFWCHQRVELGKIQKNNQISDKINGNANANYIKLISVSS